MCDQMVPMGVNPDGLKAPELSEDQYLRIEEGVDGGDDPDDPCPNCGWIGLHDHLVHIGENPKAGPDYTPINPVKR